MSKITGPNVIDGRVLNLIPSPPDVRDYPPLAMSSEALIIPKEFTTVNDKHVVRDQGIMGACVGYGITDAETASLGLHDARWFDQPLSASFIWMGAKETDQIMEPSTLAGKDGTFIRAGLKIARKYGNIYEKWSPLGAITAYTSPEMYADAAWIKIASFHRLRQEDYVRTLLMGSQIVIGIQTWGSFFDPKDKVMTEQDATGSSFGGHCCRIVGYENYGDNTIFHIGNSWGTNWGNRGYARVDSGWLNKTIFEAFSMSIPKIDFFG